MNLHTAATTVLVVDDDLISRTALVAVLRRVRNLEVVEAADGQMAWTLLENGLRPTACCTDLGMPVLDGLGLMDRIRAHPTLNDLPVVLITGTADRETVLAAMQRGAAGYIVKPFVAADTLGTLQRVIRTAQMRSAEAPAETRTRLQQDISTQIQLLITLRDRARELGATLASQADSAGVQVHLDSLRTACLTLGLWRSAELIESTPALAEDMAQGPLVLSEVVRQATSQLLRLGVAPSAVAA